MNKTYSKFHAQLPNNTQFTVRTVNQAALVDNILNHTLSFSAGPAGTGKTYVSVVVAVHLLTIKNEIEKIILARPAVEAGEKIGYLPGTAEEKLAEFMSPLKDSLRKCIPKQKLEQMEHQNIIEIAPVGFLRGRTFENCIVILDEAQNMTPNQMKMILTRIGKDSKMVITGDVTQGDLNIAKDGLTDAMERLKGKPDISVLEFDEQDIVRHKIVKTILKAYNDKG